MLVYQIEDSREGLYTAVFHAYKHKERPDAVIAAGGAFQPDLTAVVRAIPTEKSAARRVEQGVRERLRGDRMTGLEYVFKSGAPDKYTVLCRYLCLLFEEVGAPDMLWHPAVIAYEDIVYRVQHEINRLRGFLRFQETAGGAYYAQIKPDHDVTGFLMPHFTARYPNMNFAIHDLRRNLMGLYNTKESCVVPLSGKVEVTLSEAEGVFSALWKRYYDTVTIEGRKNKRLQDNWLPQRYREMMPETLPEIPRENP